MWCGWLVPVFWVGLKLGLHLLLLFLPSISDAPCFLSHRKGEIKEGLWKHWESCNYLYSPCLSVFPSVPVHFLITSILFPLLLGHSFLFLSSFESVYSPLSPYSLFSLDCLPSSLPRSFWGSLKSGQGLPGWKRGWEEKRLDETRG